MRKIIKLFISPHFLVKYYLTRDLKHALKKYKIKGTLLDVGCGQKPYLRMFTGVTGYTGIDFKNYSKNREFYQGKPDIFFGESYQEDYALPFTDESFDNSASFQVAEHHPDFERHISELVRVTKRGGYILISAPFIEPLHEEPRDFQRITFYGIKNQVLKNKCVLCAFYKEGSLFSAVSALFNEYLINLSKINRIFYAASAVIFFPFLIYSYTCLFLDKLFPSNQIYLNYLAVIRKK